MGQNLRVDSHTHPWLTDEIDKSELQRIEARFLAHHRYRLDDAKERLPQRARHVLSALPLLLHINHPALPGFSGYRAPQGITGYRPNPGSIRAARQFANGFAYHQQTAPQPELRAVYFMGSAGSVAQTRSSDLDIWVCLASEHHALMDAKLAKLTRWAAGLGVELQCFTVDPRQFTGGCELAFSPLLLDEFYRSACLVAGQYPLWWLIPPTHAQSYRQIARRLIDQKHVSAEAYLDFGPVTPFTVLELFAAGVRELERSVDTPHKSLLKLALLESYQAGYAPLSQRYKEVVAAGTPPQRIDGYLMLAGLLDEYFAARPEFARRKAFMHRAWLTKTARGNARLWKNPAWWELAHAWGYDPLQIDRLRWPNIWSLREIIDEHHRTTAEFAHTLSFLRGLGRTGAPAPAERAAWSDLHHRLDRMRALLLDDTQYNDKLLHAIVPRAHQGNARVEQNPEGRWVLQEEGTPIIRRLRLVEVFLWLKRQGLSLESLQSSAPRDRQIYAALKLGPYVAVVNAEARAITPADEQGDALITLANDPLSYGSNRVCLARHVDLLHTPRSGRYEARHWDNLGQALCAILNLPHAHIVCIGDIRRERIKQRLQQLISDARKHLAHDDSLYIFTLGQRLCCIHRDKHGTLSASEHVDGYACFTQLPSAGTAYVSGFHPQAEERDKWLVDHDVFAQPVVVVTIEPQHALIDYRDPGTRATLTAPPRNREDFLQSLSLFIALLKKRGITTPQVLQRHASGLVTPAVRHDVGEHLRYRLIFRQTTDGWSVQCGQDTWRRKKIDHRLLRLVRRQVLEHRASRDGYPIYLTDIQLVDGDFLTHLRAKFALESALTARVNYDSLHTNALHKIGDPM